MKFSIYPAIAALVIGAPILAQDGQQQDATATQSAASQPAEDERSEEEKARGQEVVCRTERITGSLTRRSRTCMTRDEWAAVEARTRDDMIRSGRNASGGVECRQDAFGGC
ncbi:hypothetical protein [Aurantiacibacter odishensis]|uniref:hypothetical protein n=1 Tax=Aurantiacibacter odishensis TaxID=1155476 RepID=UPI000E74AB38|nr:hypothetical protein [Aurantiacibacter odishensis]